MAALELVSFSREPPRFPSSATTPFSPLPAPCWKWNPLFRGLRLPRGPVIPRSSSSSSRMAQLFRSNPSPGIVPRAAAVSSSSSSSSSSPSSSSREVVVVEEPKRGPLGGLVDAALRALKALRKPAAAVLLLGLLLAADPYAALAASGGRMGGRSFSSSSPSVSSSRSYSVPSGSSFSFSTPYYYAPSPFFGGGGGLYVGFGAGSGFFLLMAGFAAVVLLSGFLSDRSDDGSVLTATQKTSVLKLQVGLLGLARTFQKDLERIAETADTSTPEGLSYILTETTLALLRHPDCCISGYSSVTILVAADGVHKLPVINGSANLKEALQKLGAIPSRQIMAVEVLWTPQNENDSLSERELLEDYPLLRPL